MPPPQQLLSSGVSSIRWLNARCQSSVVVLVFFTLLVSLPLRSSSPSSSSLSPSTDTSSGSQSDPEPCPAAQEWIDLHGFFCFTLMNSTYLKNSTELRLREPRAIQMFCEMDRILEKIDCDQPFSVNVERNQCKLCREAFRDWSCSMLTDTTPEGLIDCVTSLMPCPSCASICHRVMRLCPYLSPDRVQTDFDGKALPPHVSQYGGHPAFYCPEETIHPSDPAYPSYSSFCYGSSHYYYSHDDLYHEHNHYLSVCHEPHSDYEGDSADANSNHYHNKRHPDSGQHDVGIESNNDPFDGSMYDGYNGNDHHGHHSGPEKYYTSCCWAYAPGSAVEDDPSEFSSTSSLKPEEPDWSAHVSAYDSPSYKNSNEPSSSSKEKQRQSDTRVILNCCDGNGDCKVSDRDITSSQQSHRQNLANDDDEDNKPHLEQIKKGRTSRSRSSNIDTYGSDTRYRERVNNNIDDLNEDETEKEGRENELFLGGAAAELLTSPRRLQSEDGDHQLEPETQPPVPTTSIDYEDELLLDTDSDIDSDSDNEIEGGSSSSTESEDLLTTDLELDDGDDYHRHSRRSNIDINGRSVIISSSSASQTKHKNSLHKNNLIITTSQTTAKSRMSHNSNYNSRKKNNYLSSLQQQNSNSEHINTRFQNNDYKIHHNQKDEFMALVMGDRRVSPFKPDKSGLMKNAALRPIRAAQKSLSGNLAIKKDGVKVSSDAGTSSTFMTMAFASDVPPVSPNFYKWGSAISLISQSRQWSRNSELLSLPMKTFSSASSSAPSHTIHHDCCSSLLFLLLLLIFTTTNFLPIYYLLGFSTTDTCARSLSSRKELRRKTSDKWKTAGLQDIHDSQDVVRENEDAKDVDTKSIGRKNTLDNYYLYREIGDWEGSGSERVSTKSEKIRRLFACYLTGESQNTFALLLQKLPKLSVMNLRLQLIWTLNRSRQLVLYKLIPVKLKRRATVSTCVGDNLLCPLSLQLLQIQLLCLLLVVFVDSTKSSNLFSGTYSKEIPMTILRTLRHISDSKRCRRNCRVLLVVQVLSLLFLRRKRRIMRQKQYHTEFYYNNYLRFKTSTISDDYSKLSQFIRNYKQNKDLIQIETTTINVTTTITTNKPIGDYYCYVYKYYEYRYEYIVHQKSIVKLLQSVHLRHDLSNPKGLLHLFNTDTITLHYDYRYNYNNYGYDSNSNEHYNCYDSIAIDIQYIVVHYYSGQGPGRILTLFSVTLCPRQLPLLLLLLLLLRLALRRYETKNFKYYYYGSSGYYNRFYFYSYYHYQYNIPNQLLFMAKIDEPFVTRQYYYYHFKHFYSSLCPSILSNFCNIVQYCVASFPHKPDSATRGNTRIRFHNNLFPSYFHVCSMST